MLKHRLHPPYSLAADAKHRIHACKSSVNPERGVDIHFIVEGKNGAVQFTMASNWHVWEMGQPCRFPLALGLAVHRLGGSELCPILGTCSIEEVGTGAQLIKSLVEGGDEAVFDILGAIYEEKLG